MTDETDDRSPDEDTAEVAAELHGCPLVESHGQTVLHPARDRYLDVVKALTDDGYAMGVDLTGVD